MNDRMGRLFFRLFRWRWRFAIGWGLSLFLAGTAHAGDDFIRVWLPTGIERAESCAESDQKEAEAAEEKEPRLQVERPYGPNNCWQIRATLPLIKELQSLIRDHSSWRFRVTFIPWTFTRISFDDAIAFPEKAPDITWIPSTWEASLKSHLEPLGKPSFDAPKCVKPSDTAVLMGCDVRLVLLWKDLVKIPEDVPEKSPGKKAVENDQVDENTRLKMALGETDWPLQGPGSFEAVARALDSPFVIENDGGFDVLHNFTPFLWAFGGDYLSRPGTVRVDSALDTDKARAAVGYLSGAVSNRWLKVDRRLTGSLQEQFMKREVGMVISTPFVFARLCRSAKAADQHAPFVGCDKKAHLGVYWPPRAPGSERKAFAGGAYLGLWRRASRATSKAELAAILSALIERIQSERSREYLNSVGLFLQDDAGKAFEGKNREVVTRALNEFATPYPVDPMWLEAMESKETIEGFHTLWAQLENRELAERNLRDISKRVHNQIAWWPRRGRLVATTLLTLFIAIVMLGAYRARVVRKGQAEEDGPPCHHDDERQEERSK